MFILVLPHYLDIIRYRDCSTDFSSHKQHVKSTIDKGGWDLLQTGCLASLNPRFSPLLDLFVSNNEEGTTQKKTWPVLFTTYCHPFNNCPVFLGDFHSDNPQHFWRVVINQYHQSTDQQGAELPRHVQRWYFQVLLLQFSLCVKDEL